MANQEFVDVYEANWIDEARVRRDALLQLCTDGFDLACVRVRDEQIEEYLHQ